MSVLHEQLTGQVTRDDLCSTCGLPVPLHRETTGRRLIGCEGAVVRVARGLTETRLVRREVADPCPAASHAVYDALLVDCAHLSAAFSVYSPAEQWVIARTLARVAIAEWQLTEGRR